MNLEYGITTKQVDYLRCVVPRRFKEYLPDYWHTFSNGKTLNCPDWGMEQQIYGLVSRKVLNKENAGEIIGYLKNDNNEAAEKLLEELGIKFQ